MAYRWVGNKKWSTPQPWAQTQSWAQQPPVVQPQPVPAQLPANSNEAPEDPGGFMPWSADLDRILNTARTNYDNTLAALAAREPLIQREYGYDAEGRIDPNNPFSKAQLLQRTYQQTQKGTGNQYAARGQLYSGALQRAKNENQFNYQAQDAQLRGSYAQQLAELARLRAEAQNQYNMQRSGAYWDLIMDQLAKRAAGEVRDPGSGGGEPAPVAPAQPGNVYEDPAVRAYLQALYQEQQRAMQSGGPVPVLNPQGTNMTAQPTTKGRRRR